jgi:surfeit locus 1 family protein
MLINIKYNKIELFPLLFTILTFCILVSLGFWQIYRLHKKELFLTSIQTNLINDPVDLQSIRNENLLYAKIKIYGHFLSDLDIHLYGRKKNSYYLLSPFQTNDNQIIPVIRGWFATKDKKAINHKFETANEEIVGFVLAGEKNRFYIPSNDLKNNIWFSLDLTQLSQIFGFKLTDFYLLQTDITNLHSEYLKSISINNLLHIKNDHLEYAITWFSLALCLMIIFIIYIKKKAENQSNN